VATNAYRYVKVPESVGYMGALITFQMVLEHLADHDKVLSMTAKGGRIANRVLAEFKDKVPGDVVKLHPDDLLPFHTAAENPVGGWLGYQIREEGKLVKDETVPARYMQPFFEALHPDNTKEPKEEPAAG